MPNTPSPTSAAAFDLVHRPARGRHSVACWLSLPRERTLTQPPVVAIHGLEDPIMPPPRDEVLNYLTHEKEQTLVPVLLPNVRHFPMLEDERFPRMINDYLEAADISRVEQKERWKRRHR